MPFTDVRDKSGRLLFRFDPGRDLIEIARRSGRERAVVHLADYRPPNAAAVHPVSRIPYPASTG